MTLKDGVKINLLHPDLTKALGVADKLWIVVFPDDDGMTVTSGHEGSPGDGVHGRTSKHYIANCASAFGEAVDLRVNDIKQSRAHTYACILETILYFSYGIKVRIFCESILKQSAHIHIQLE